MKMENMSDSELVKNCLQGDMEAYRQIMDKYTGKAMALAINILRNREDAEDVCQEAFISAYHNLDKFDLQGSFKNWFYTMIYNRCIDKIRKNKRFFQFFARVKSSQPLIQVNPEPTNPTSVCSLDKRYLQTLSPKERLALFLWAQDSFAGEEIAAILKCSPATARVHLYKARKKIKAVIGGENVEV
jgi:RNA polymerase sigma-70 factor (ECF subfamily)